VSVAAIGTIEEGGEAGGTPTQLWVRPDVKGICRLSTASGQVDGMRKQSHGDARSRGSGPSVP